ncbi:cutinase [Arthrobacter sp. SLBN-122]|nr:cutinase [Arthrobacter sp. SLBN-122]
MENFYDNLNGDLHSGIAVDVRSHEIQYDAIPVPMGWGILAGVWNGYYASYLSGVQYGVNLLSAYVQDHLDNCKSEHLILAGYSQGADVVHQVWNTFTATGNAGLDRTRGRLDGVVLFADPRFNPYQKNAIPALSLDEGSFASNISSYGIYAGVPGTGPVNWFAGQEVYHFMKSYCDFNDPVCNGGFSVDVHTNYVGRRVTADAGHSLSRWLVGHYFH